MMFLDETSDVIGILEKELDALWDETCSITSDRANNVVAAYQLVQSKPGRNTPKRRAHTILTALMARSKKLFVLSAMAATNGLISTYNIRSMFVVDELHRWWETIDIPPKLTAFSNTFFDNKRRFAESCQVILDRLFPGHDADTLVSLSREQLISLLTSQDLSLSESETSEVTIVQIACDTCPQVRSNNNHAMERSAKRRRSSTGHPACSSDATSAIDGLEPGRQAIIRSPALCLEGSVISSTPRSETDVLQSGLKDRSQHGHLVPPQLNPGIPADHGIVPAPDSLTQIAEIPAKALMQNSPKMKLESPCKIVTKLQPEDLFSFLLEYQGGCGLLTVQLRPKDTRSLPSIGMTFGSSEGQDIAIIFNREICARLIRHTIQKGRSKLDFVP